MPVETRQKSKIEKNDDKNLKRKSEDPPKSKQTKKAMKLEVPIELEKLKVKTQVKSEYTGDIKNVKLESDLKSISKIEASPDDQNSTTKHFWLMKSEPETRMQNGQDMKFGIEDLKLMENQTEHWDGVC